MVAARAEDHRCYQVRLQHPRELVGIHSFCRSEFAAASKAFNITVCKANAAQTEGGWRR
jgi:hypothetical protein